MPRSRASREATFRPVIRPAPARQTGEDEWAVVSRPFVSSTRIVLASLVGGRSCGLPCRAGRSAGVRAKTIWQSFKRSIGGAVCTQRRAGTEARRDWTLPSARSTWMRRIFSTVSLKKMKEPQRWAERTPSCSCRGNTMGEGYPSLMGGGVPSKSKYKNLPRRLCTVRNTQADSSSRP